MKLNYSILLGLLCLELLVSCYYFRFGNGGYTAYQRLQHDIGLLQNEITSTRDTIAALEQEVVQWQTDSWCKEKMAREQLQLMYNNDELQEEIYYYSPHCCEKI